MRTTKSVGALFTDNKHSIIFADNGLQSVLQVNATWLAGKLGKPVFDLFGFTITEYIEFLEQYVVDDRIAKTALDLQVGNGQVIPTVITGVVNTNAENDIMGIDYRVHATSTATAPINVNTMEDSIVQEILCFYFKRQLEGLYQIATEWGGRQLGNYLNRVINETAAYNTWDIVMDANNISISVHNVAQGAYLGLMTKAGSYMSTCIGSKLVQRQIVAVNKEVNPTTFDYIDQNWSKNI